MYPVSFACGLLHEKKCKFSPKNPKIITGTYVYILKIMFRIGNIKNCQLIVLDPPVLKAWNLCNNQYVI